MITRMVLMNYPLVATPHFGVLNVTFLAGLPLAVLDGLLFDSLALGA
jgi:hypothetical protein